MRTVAAICLVAACVGACATRSARDPIGPVKPDRQWDEVFTRLEGWTGGDIASSFDLSDGRVLWLFGDSWIGPVVEGRHVESVMIRNAAAWHTVQLPIPTFLIGAADSGGRPTSWLDPARDGPPSPHERVGEPSWYWPMGGAAVVPGPNGRDRLVIFVTRVGRRGDPNGVWDFRRIGGEIAIIDNWREPPHRWAVRLVNNPLVSVEPRVAEPARDGVSWGEAVVVDRADIYVFGVRAPLNQDSQLVLAKAPAASIEDTTTWRFFTGGDWSEASESAIAIAEGITSEFSVERFWIGGRERLVLVQNEPMLGRRVLARTAWSPEGPWSEPATLFTVREPEMDPRLMMYAAKSHARLSRRNELLVTYIINSTDFWHAAADASLYRPRFVRVPAKVLPTPP